MPVVSGPQLAGMGSAVWATDRRPVSPGARLAETGRQSSYDHATDEGGLRVAALLRLRMGGLHAVQQELADTVDLQQWLRTELAGCQLQRSTFSALAEGRGILRDGHRIQRRLETIQSDVETAMRTQDGTNAALAQQVGAFGASATDSETGITAQLHRALCIPADIINQEEVVREIVGAVGDLIEGAVSSVADVVVEVLEFIPGVGIIGAALKAIRSSYRLVAGALSRRGFTGLLRSSISVIEREALWAADWFEERNQMLAGKDLVNAAITGVAHGLGFVGAALGPVAKAVTGLVNLAARILITVRDAIAMHKANKALREGNITLALIREAPVLGLCLPHLPGADALSVLGVVSPGFSATRDPVRAEQICAALRHPDNRALKDALFGSGTSLGGSATALATARLENPWKRELERLATIYKATGGLASSFPWKLVRADQVVFDPDVVDIRERSLARISSRREDLAAMTRLLQIPTLLRLPGAVEATVPADFHAGWPPPTTATVSPVLRVHGWTANDDDEWPPPSTLHFDGDGDVDEIIL